MITPSQSDLEGQKERQEALSLYTQSVSDDPFPHPKDTNWVQHALSVVEDDGKHALYLGFVNNDLKMHGKPPKRRSRSARGSGAGAGGNFAGRKLI